MAAKIRLGCLGVVFVLGLALIIFWRPIVKHQTDSMFRKTTAAVVDALPRAEQDEAVEVCGALWDRIREHGVPEAASERYKTFASEAFAMLKNQEVTEEEARAFVQRARELLETLESDTPYGAVRAP